jgi:murein DD-endopeptidase MepM/ murein hydrolase activator NlpD
LLVAVPLALPVVAEAQSLSELQDRLRDAAAERAAVEERLATAARELDELEVEIARAEAERDELRQQVSQLEGDLEALSDLVAVRVRGVFMHGSALDPIAVFLASDDPDAALSRAQTVQRLVAGDQVSSEALVAGRARLDAVADRLAEQEAALDAALARQRVVAEQLTDDLAAAQELEARLTREERAERERLERQRQERERRAREERERRAAQERAAQQERAAASRSAGTTSTASSAPAPSGGGMACPLDQPRHFTDTWGAPRSGGRAHRGTDILGPYGIPVRAITSGTWAIQRPGPSAGLWAILRGDDGNQYWYMHLQSHTVANGARVSAGQQVATNGDTGNARGTPHIHFELHPGGGAAINPYPLLRRVCG